MLLYNAAIMISGGYSPPSTRRKSAASAGCAVFVLGFIGAIAACNDSAPATGGAACTYQQTIGCTGPDGCEGVSTCAPDLSGYEECVCASEAGSPAGDASTADAGQPRRDGGTKDGAR